MVAGPFTLVWSSFGKTGPPHRSHRSWHGRRRRPGRRLTPDERQWRRLAVTRLYRVDDFTSPPGSDRRRVDQKVTFGQSERVTDSAGLLSGLT
jgi:hypothetical protein